MAVEQPRKKSPRAPSIPLSDALERAIRIYDKERVHAAPADVVAQHMGYKNASSGVALSALASLRYYGLIERPREGFFAVSQQVEAFKFAPNEDLKRSILLRFLSTPPLFAELLDRYQSGLPSDSNLRYELIQRGFLPGTAENVVGVFKRSVDFVGVFENSLEISPQMSEEELADEPTHENAVLAPSLRQVSPTTTQSTNLLGQAGSIDEAGHDRIPIRLSKGRRAWLVIPEVFYEADKQRLKAQIDLLLTAEDES
jgi:hypothetical protein